MRILHLIDSQGLYGAEKVLLSLASLQLQQGDKPIILSAGVISESEKPLEREAARLGIEVIKHRMRPGFNPLGVFAVNQIAKKLKVDVMHSHGYKFNVQFALMPRGLRAAPVVTTLHGYTNSRRFSKSWLYQTVDQILVNRLSHIVFVAPHMKNISTLRYIPDDNCSVILNGVDTDALKSAVAESIELKEFIPDFENFVMGKKVVGAIGRLSPEKGFDILIKAFAEVLITHPDIRLIILGEGAQRQQLEQLARELGVSEYMRMPGYVENAGRYCSAFDVFVMPSYTEGLPISLLEALVAGAKIVASDIAGVSFVLDSGKHGVLTPPGDSGRLARELQGILSSFNTTDNIKDAEALFDRFSDLRMVNAYRKVYCHALV